MMQAGRQRAAALWLWLVATPAVTAQADTHPASQAASRPTGSVRGRCHTEGGAAVAGAQVRLVRFRDDSLPRPARRLDQLVTIEAQSDASGEFRLPAEPGRWYWLWAAQGDLRVARPMLRVVSGCYLDVPLAPGDVRTGRVHADGKPAAGATVTASELLQPERCGQGLYVETVTSAADGTFRLLLPAWLRPALFAEAGDRVGAGVVGPGAGALELDLAARPEGRVVVVDSAGKPVAGAHLERHDPHHPPVPVGRTDERGSARVPWHPAIDTIVARSTDLATGGALGGDTPDDTRIPTQRFQLQTGTRLRGRLVDAARQPLAGRRLLLHSHDTSVLTDPNPASRAEATTDAEGRFELPAVRTRARATLYLDDQGVWVPLLLPATDQPTLGDVEFAGAARLQVSVLDAQGTPLAGALVLIHRIPTVDFQAAGETVPSRVAFTDPAGRAILDGLAPGPYRLLAAAPGQPFARLTVTLRRGPVERKLVQLPAGGGVITGRVLGPDGAPVPFADLQLQPFEQGLADQEFTLNTWTFLTGPDGRFQFRGLPEGGQVWIMGTAARHGATLSGNRQSEAGQQDVELRLQ